MHWPFRVHSRIVDDQAVSRYLRVLRPVWTSETDSQLRALSSNRKIEVAVAIPMNFQRSIGVLDSLRAHVLACAVIDLAARLFDHSQNRDDSASLLQLPTHQTNALEI